MKQVLGDGFCGDRTEIEALAAREDGGQNFIRLGGGEDEFHMRRGFFERLKQRVEGGVRQHVDLVDVEDFELPPRRSETDGFPEIADLLDAVVRGSVDFQDIERAALGDLDTDVFIRVEVRLRAAGAVQRLGENPCRRCLTRAPRSYEKIGVG